MFKKLIFVLCLSLPFSSVFALKVEELTTPKGITVLYVKDTTTPLISLSLAFKGAGLISDGPNKEGAGLLLANLLLESGTKDLSKEALLKKFKELGVLGGIRFAVDYDNMLFELKCPKENLKSVLLLLQDMITEKNQFKAPDLQRIKRNPLTGMVTGRGGNLSLGEKFLMKQLFHGHIYEHPAYGMPDAIQAMHTKDMQEAKQNKLARDNLIVSVVGNIDNQEVIQGIDEAFQALPGKANLPKISMAKEQMVSGVQVIPEEAPQSSVVFGMHWVSPHHKDFYASLLLNHILGAPFTGEFWNEVREKRGLVYRMDTDIDNLAYGQIWTGAFETEHHNVKEAIELIQQILERIKAQGVQKSAFQDAKTALMGSFALNFTSPDSIGQNVLGYYLAGFGADYINQRNQALEKVQLSDVNRFAKEYLTTHKPLFIVVGNAED